LNERGKKTYAISNSSAHTRNHNNTAAIAKPHHLFRHRLRRHKAPRHIHAHHRIAVLRCILQRRGLLLDSCCGDEAIEAAMRGGDVFDDGVQLLDVAHVDSPVGERGAEFVLRTLLDPGEVGGRGFEAVERVDCV
jgi:hypothetical protein